jgi:hypothetical protein
MALPNSTRKDELNIKLRQLICIFTGVVLSTHGGELKVKRKEPLFIKEGVMSERRN